MWLLLLSFLKHLFIYGCAVSPVLCGLLSSCSDQGSLLVAACGLLIAVASPVEEHRLSAARFQQLRLLGSRAQAQ